MYARMNAILMRLTRMHLPKLLDQLPEEAQRHDFLTRRLAAHGILVIAGNFKPGTSPDHYLQHINTWISEYHHLYHVLVVPLFKHRKGLVADWGDDEIEQPIVILKGELEPVLELFALGVCPYIALRNRAKSANTDEINQVADHLLQRLGSTDLPYTQYAELRQQTNIAIQRLLATSVRQLGLCQFSPPILHGAPRVPVIQPAPPQQMPDEPEKQKPYPAHQRPRHPLSVANGDDRPVPPIKPPPGWKKKDH